MTDLHASTTVICSDGPVERDTFATLAGWDGGPCITISLPLDPARPDARRDHIELENLLQRADELLREADHDVAASLLARFEDVLARERVDGPGARGLVLVAAPGRYAELTVPTAVHATVHVGDHVNLLPLLPARRTGDRYAVLCLSEAHVRYLEGDRFHLYEGTLPDMPRSLEQALWYDEHERPERQHPASIHGVVDVDEIRREHLRRFLRRVDYAVVAHLGTAERVPVVLVGTEDIVRRYADTSHYPWLVVAGGGNADHRPASDLHAAAWPEARAQLRAPLVRLLGSLADLRGTGLTAEHPVDVDAAAASGQISTLVVAARWCGPLPTATPGVGAPEPDAQARTNDAVVQTLRHRGNVWTAADHELSATGVAAKLRY